MLKCARALARRSAPLTQHWSVCFGMATLRNSAALLLRSAGKGRLGGCRDPGHCQSVPSAGQAGAAGRRARRRACTRIARAPERAPDRQGSELRAPAGPGQEPASIPAAQGWRPRRGGSGARGRGRPDPRGGGAWRGTARGERGRSRAGVTAAARRRRSREYPRQPLCRQQSACDRRRAAPCTRHARTYPQGISACSLDLIWLAAAVFAKSRTHCWSVTNTLAFRPRVRGPASSFLKVASRAMRLSPGF